MNVYLRDFADIPLGMASDFGIKYVALDICVLSLRSHLVGVIEIR